LNLRILLPTTKLINISIISIGYSSFKIARLRFMKSIQTLSLLFFYNTSMMLEICLSCVIDLKKPLSNNLFISYLTWSIMYRSQDRLKLLPFHYPYLMVLEKDLSYQAWLIYQLHCIIIKNLYSYAKYCHCWPFLMTLNR
jgi:hypothetical protein